jgi:hypothetical protein
MARKKKNETKVVETPNQSVDQSTVSPTPLTIGQIVEHEKRYDEIEKIVFEDGNYVHIYKKFNPTKIEKAILDYGKFTDDLSKNKVILENEKSSKMYILHVVLEFSTLGDSVPNDFNAKVQAFNYLTESNYVNKIVESFDKDEFQKAIDAFINMFQKIIVEMNENPKFKKQVEEKIKELAKEENNDIENNEVDIDGI